MSICQMTPAENRFASAWANFPGEGIKAPILFHFKSRYLIDLLWDKL